MPEWPGAQANTIPSTRWFPANPSILLVPIPPAWRLVYLDRFVQRRPLIGWYLRAHGSTTCASIEQRYIATKSFSNAD